MLLVVIFILVLLFNQLPNFFRGLTHKLVDWRTSDANISVQLRVELKALHGELHGLSIVDEFAKCARIERKIIKTKDKIAALCCHICQCPLSLPLRSSRCFARAVAVSSRTSHLIPDWSPRCGQCNVLVGRQSEGRV